MANEAMKRHVSRGDLTLVLPSLFCNIVYQGGGYHLPYELEIDWPQVWLFGTMV